MLSVSAANGQADAALDHLTRLQALTAALAEAVTSKQVANAILAHSLSVLGANAGVIYRLSDDGSEFVCLRMIGFPAEVENTWGRFPADARAPIADAVREGRLVVVPTLAEMRVRYPMTARFPTLQQEAAAIALPLIVHGRPIGGIGLLFSTDRTFPDPDRVFLLTVAGLCAQALDRARLLDTERAARERAERAERDARRSEQFYRLLAEAVPGMAWSASTKDGLDYLSRQWEEYTGLTLEQIRKAGWQSLHHPDEVAAITARFREAAQAGQPFEVEFRYRRHDEQYRWFLGRQVPIADPDGRGVRLVGTLIDIDDRKQAEEALNRERELLRTIIDRIPVMLTVYDPDEKVLRLNPAFERAVGWSSHDAASVSLMEECYPDPAYREQVREFMQSCRDGWMDIRMRTRSGRDLETSWANVRLADGTQVGIGIDITDRKRYEQSLQEADRRKDDFLAMLAHELRNPLAPIRNAAQVFRLLGPADPNLQRAREMIERQVQQLTRLVDDLLDVSRITRGKIALHKEPVDLATVIARAIETSRPVIDARRHELTVTLPRAPLRLAADATRLAQVFSNLLNNAAKYTREGGHIALTVEPHPGEAVVRIRDNGMGIPADLLPQLFELFIQGDRSLARSEGGLGIGLTLVKNLVEMHGGRVEARSDGRDKGSEFVVRLPTLEMNPASAAESGEGEPSSSPPSPCRRVMVVDDNVDVADSLAMVLRAWGHEVHALYDGLAALSTVEQLRPEIILLDIGLPQMDGYEVARRLRACSVMRDVLLIALTGYGQEEDRRRAKEAGFDVHLTKPADPRKLQELLGSCAGNV
jgi:PAS domain S-box-containing protein